MAVDIENETLNTVEYADEVFSKNADVEYNYIDESGKEQKLDDNSKLEGLFDEYGEGDLIPFVVNE